MQLEGKSLRSDFIRFVTASSASLLVFSLYSMIDGLLVSLGVNEYAMSAVNLGIPYVNALFSLAVMFAVGSSTIIAIQLGQGKREEANRLFSQNFCLLLVIGVLLSVVVIVFREPIAIMLGADEVTLEYVKQYLLGIAPFSTCFIISYNLEVLVKTDGYPRLAVITVTTGAVANGILAYLTIFVLEWGVFGAAVAAGTSQLITCIIYLSHFFSSKCSFRLAKFKFDPKIYTRLIPIGLSDGVTELCNGVMILLFNRTVQKYLGADGVVSYTVIAYMNTIIINLMMGISQGMQPLVSYRYGKGDVASCKKLLSYGLKTALLFGGVCFVGLYLFAPQVVQAYLSAASDSLVTDSIAAFRQYSFAWLLVGFNVVIGGFFTALERPVPAIAISTGRGLIVQSAVLVVLAAITAGTGLWFAPMIAEVLVLGVAVLFLRKHLQKMNMA